MEDNVTIRVTVEVPLENHIQLMEKRLSLSKAIHGKVYLQDILKEAIVDWINKPLPNPTKR